MDFWSWELDCTFSQGPVLSEHPETWTRCVPGPDLGLGAPELSSVLCALALDPLSSSAALSCACPKGPRRQCLTPLFCLFRGIWPRLAVPETQFSPLLLHDFSFVHVIFFFLIKCWENAVSVWLCPWGRWAVGEHGKQVQRLLGSR